MHVDAFATAGGLIGYIGGTLGSGTSSYSYAIGAVSIGRDSVIGGFVGTIESGSGNLTDTYWDTITSGITNPSQGAGNVVDDPGITGLTTSQLQSGLPAGFSNTIWAESGSINNGLPYLLAIPQK